MGKCVASKRSGVKCGEETEPGYKYCEEHSQRTNAIKERQMRAAETVIEATQLFKDDSTSNEVEQVKADNELAPRKMPLDQRNIYDKTADELNGMIEWEKKTWQKVSELNPDEWRYQDKAGAEQLHSFISLYERAQDRVLRGVTAVAKLNIDAQSVNINKMVRELIKNCVTRTLQRMDMTPEQITQARQYLAEEFERAERNS